MICCGSVDIDSDGDVSAATAIVCDVTLGVDVLEIGASMLKCWRQTEQKKGYFEQNEITWGHPALETEIVEGSVPMVTLIVGSGLKIPSGYGWHGFEPRCLSETGDYTTLPGPILGSRNPKGVN